MYNRRRNAHLTQLMWQLVAEYGQRRSQSWAPGQRKGGAHGQAVCKVMNAVADRDHVREQALLWMGGERKKVKCTQWSTQPFPFLLYNYERIIICVVIDQWSLIQRDSEWRSSGGFTSCARGCLCFCFWEGLFFPIYLQAKKSHMCLTETRL